MFLWGLPYIKSNQQIGFLQKPGKRSPSLPLSPDWEGHFPVLLTIDTAVQTAEKGWTHASQVKKIETRQETPE